VNNEEIKDFALALLRADSETEVIQILKDKGYWDDHAAWRLLGDSDGNFATIGNQQAKPEAALVEKIVNSVDARLLNECLCTGMDPESPSAPSNIRQAISVFFEGKSLGAATESSIGDWLPKKQLEQARHITLAVTGNKPRQGMPCISIADDGEGQSPGRFADTFLSINKSNKLRIRFVQGKFNMGGTGVLKFCGNNSLQLLISKRNPRIVNTWRGKGTKWTSSDPRDEQWGVTVVRRDRPREKSGEIRNSAFRYLAPIQSADGMQVLSFKSETLPIFPNENRPYERESDHGSIIKLYEYDVKGFSSAALMKGGILSRLEVLLPQIALPVRVHECRDYRGDEGRSFENSLVGLSVRLGENRAQNLEDGYPTTSSFVVRGERINAEIFAFKEDKAETYAKGEGIIFTINGQTHGAIPRTFFERSKVKMGRLARSLLIMVDCTSMSTVAREDLFMNSRDRLSNGVLRKDIEEELEDIIGKHEGLRELRERRRNAEIQHRLEESKPLEDILDSIFKTSPTLSKLFVFGQRLSKPHRSETDGKGGGQGTSGGLGTFEPKTHPTYFRFHKKKYGEVLEKNAEVDRRCRIRFETDAQNDYFERSHYPGMYEVEAIDGLVEDANISHSVTIHNGIANWSIKLPDDYVDVGDVVTLQCTVNDETLVDPFINVLKLTMHPYDEASHARAKYSRLNSSSGGQNGAGGSGQSGEGGKGQGQGNIQSGGIALPHIERVHRNDAAWTQHSFDENTACKVIEDDVNGASSYSFYVNVDNIYLRTELKDSRADVAVQQTKFIWGNVLVGLALLHADKESRANINGEDGPVESVFSRIEKTTRALGPFLIPMIDQLGAISEEDVARLAQRGDDE